MLHTAEVCRRVGTSYTCIRVSETDKFVQFVSMENLWLEKMDSKAFHQEWEPYTEYPVRRAAELYLAAPYREIEDKASAHLAAIIVDPTTVYEIEPKPPKKEPAMAKIASAKTPAVKTPAVKTPAVKTPAVKTPAVKTPAVKTPAVKTPAVKTPAVKTPAVKTPAVKTPAVKTPAVKTPAKAKAEAAEPAKKVTPVRRAVDDSKYVMADAEAPRRGETAEYAAAAVKLKEFTRAQLVTKMVAAGKDEAKARIKVADMVYFQVIVKA